MLGIQHNNLCKFATLHEHVMIGVVAAGSGETALVRKKERVAYHCWREKASVAARADSHGGHPDDESKMALSQHFWTLSARSAINHGAITAARVLHLEWTSRGTFGGRRLDLRISAFRLRIFWYP